MTQTNRSQRRFARIWAGISRSVDEAMAPAKDRLFTGLPREIVEIGPGTGANFRRYRPGTRVIAFEPNRFMHDALRREAAAQGLDLDLRSGGAENLDLPNESTEIVVSSLVLCSVDDRQRAIAEIRRVLRPGGRLLFIEHVGAARGSVRRTVQRVLRRPWRAVADNCDLIADTAEVIAGSGFATVESKLEVLGSRLDPSSLTAYGEAMR